MTDFVLTKTITDHAAQLRLESVTPVDNQIPAHPQGPTRITVENLDSGCKAELKATPELEEALALSWTRNSNTDHKLTVEIEQGPKKRFEWVRGFIPTVTSGGESQKNEMWGDLSPLRLMVMNCGRQR